jgi:hypothetical protein
MEWAYQLLKRRDISLEKQFPEKGIVARRVRVKKKRRSLSPAKVVANTRT